MVVAVQKWQNVGELGPIMRCDKMFGYVSGSTFTMHYLEGGTYGRASATRLMHISIVTTLAALYGTSCMHH